MSSRSTAFEQRPARSQNVRQGAGRLPGAWSAVPAVLALGLTATIAMPAPPLLVWNASASSPVGLYAVWRASAVRPGDMVVAWAPLSARRLAADRHYLPANVPLVKRVAATNGAQICANGRWIRINGRRAAERMRRDPSGRRLPWWAGCRTLKKGEIFLLSRDRPQAFDGRYFGTTETKDIIGKATLLWPR